MKFRVAESSDVKRLNDLMARSKAYWGYSAEFMAEFMSHYQLPADYLETCETLMLFEDQQLIGFYSLESKEGGVGFLDCLFVDPNQINKGYGRILTQHALDNSKSKGWHQLTLMSDPYAQSFYEYFGFEKIGFDQTLMGRFVPKMAISLE